MNRPRDRQTEMMKSRTALAFKKLKSNPKYSIFFAIFCKYLFTYSNKLGPLL